MKKILLTALSILAIGVQQVCNAQTLVSSNLPIVVIDTYGQFIDTVNAEFIVGMGVIDNGPGVRNYVSDPFNNYNGKVEIEIHGSSTAWLPKKSYDVTTLDAMLQKMDTPLMNLPEEHDWVFKALYQDKTFLRDDLAFRIYGQMGHYSCRSLFFELIVNGDYRGVYELEEKIKRDKNRVDIAKLKDTDTSGDQLTGGYIIKLDKIDYGDQGWYSSYNSNITADSANFFLYEYPKADSMPMTQKAYIKGFFDQFENVLASSYYNSPDSGYSKYLDVSSFVDHFILNEMSRNVDGYRCSTYFYKDQDSKGDGKLRCGPAWDYNIGFDNCYYNGGTNPYGWQYQVYASQYFVPFWWWQFLSDMSFKDQLKCRYNYLRSNVLSFASLYSYIDSMAYYLDESQARNFTRWPIMGTYVWPNPTPVPANYAGEITKLKDWLQQRLTWLDSNMPGVCITGQNELAIENTLRAYPNPFHNQLYYSYELDEDAQIEVSLVNMLGQTVKSLFNGMKQKGSYIGELNPDDIPPGIYLMKIDSGNKTKFIKVIKV